MTSLFDGVAGILNDTFGASVRFAPQSGAIQDVHSVFRRGPIEVEGEDGTAVLIEAPTWRVPKGSLSPMPQRGDQITPSDGRIYAIVNEHSTGSPASDAFVIYVLERVP